MAHRSGVLAAASHYTCLHIYSTRQCAFIPVHPNPLLDLLTSDQTVLEETFQSTYVCTYCIYIDVHQICGHCHRHMPLSGSHRARASELDVAGDLQGINPTQCHAPSYAISTSLIRAVAVRVCLHDARRDVSYCLLMTIGYISVRVFPVQVHLLDCGEVTIRSLNLESCV